jgi:glyoxylase-like metal-dependent hydrolase (beta-lactamase superfamily II)
LTQLAEGVHYLGTVGKPEVLSAYLVGGGDEYALLEPGPSNTVDQTLSLIQSSGIPLDSIRHMIVTHVHLDHAGGAWKMIGRLPKADVVVYKGGGKHMADPQKLSQGAEMVLGPLYRLWGEMKALPSDRIQEVVDGDVLPVGGHHLKVIYTPGHSPFHMSVMDIESRSLITGDAVGMYVHEKETLWPASPLPSFRYEDSIETIGDLESLSPRRLLIPHYEPQSDVSHLFDLNKSTYRGWHDLLEKEPLEKGLGEVVDDLLGSSASYSWIPADELARWVITMHATGFRQYFLDRTAAK